MHTGRSLTFPQPREEDFEDVCWALSAGKSLWERGERDEALKWVRRAANAAAERDADLRAVELYKVAADMASIVDAEEASEGMPRPGGPPPEPPSDETAAEPPTRPRAAPRARARRHHRLQPPRATLRGRPAVPGPRARPPRPAAREITGHREPTDLSPEVPPAPRISERFGAFELPVDDREEETFIRPETMLRRALMAIDPNYVRRTEYNDDGSGPDPAFVHPEEDAPSDRRAEPSPPGWGWDDDEIDEEDEGETREQTSEELEDAQAEPTVRLRSTRRDADEPAARAPAPPPPARSPSASHVAGPMPGGLLTLRVALLPIPDEGDVRIVFLSADEAPPPGVATALLVPPSEEDAKLLAALYQQTEAKL